MRIVWMIAVFASLACGCRSVFRKVEGNGVMTKKENVLSSFDVVEVSGVFEVKVIPSGEFKAVVETDENLLEYIKVDQSGDRLRIRTRNSINIRPTRKLMVTIYGNNISRFELAGASSITSEGLMEDDRRIEVTIAGAGDADMEVKAPEVKVSIGGAGEVDLAGKTRDLKLSIAGAGDYTGDKLMSENVDVSIAGSGSAKVYASMGLKVSIAGSGDVYYAGKPTNIKKDIVGHGNIKEL